jgi:hypothetical protein
MDELLKPFTPNPELQERLKSKYGKKQSVWHKNKLKKP